MYKCAELNENRPLSAMGFKQSYLTSKIQLLNLIIVIEDSIALFVIKKSISF